MMHDRRDDLHDLWTLLEDHDYFHTDDDVSPFRDKFIMQYHATIFIFLCALLQFVYGQAPDGDVFDIVFDGHYKLFDFRLFRGEMKIRSIVNNLGDIQGHLFTSNTGDKLAIIDGVLKESDHWAWEDTSDIMIYLQAHRKKICVPREHFKGARYHGHIDLYIDENNGQFNLDDTFHTEIMEWTDTDDHFLNTL